METKNLNKIRSIVTKDAIEALSAGKGDSPVGGNERLEIGDVIRIEKYGFRSTVFNTKRTGMSDEDFNALSEEKQKEVGGRPAEWFTMESSFGSHSINNILRKHRDDVVWEGENAPTTGYAPTTRRPSEWLLTADAKDLAEGKKVLKVINKGESTLRSGDKQTHYLFALEDNK